MFNFLFVKINSSQEQLYFCGDANILKILVFIKFELGLKTSGEDFL